MIVAEKPGKYDSLKILEKSHCISILMALFRNGMMNRNQLYDELGETINVVIKRVDLLIKEELVYEIKMKVKPFTKGLTLTARGKLVAEKLRDIEDTLECHGTGDISRVSYPFPIDLDLEDEIMKHKLDSRYYVKFIQSLRCPDCGKVNYLMKDKDNFVWVCFFCGNKSKADPKEAHRLQLYEYFDGIGFEIDPYPSDEQEGSDIKGIEKFLEKMTSPKKGIKKKKVDTEQ